MIGIISREIHKWLSHEALVLSHVRLLPPEDCTWAGDLLVKWGPLLRVCAGCRQEVLAAHRGLFTGLCEHHYVTVASIHQREWSKREEAKATHLLWLSLSCHFCNTLLVMCPPYSVWEMTAQGLSARKVAALTPAPAMAPKVATAMEGSTKTAWAVCRVRPERRSHSCPHCF